MENKQNPESGVITPRTMYEYDTHQNIPWNDIQYNPVREYLDPSKQITQRNYAIQQKGKKDNKYLTKKGFYMDYHTKVVKALPAPCAYEFSDGFDQKKNKQEGRKHKIDSKLSKYSYLDWIATEQKNRKTPAPGFHNINKTDKQIKQQLKVWKSKKKSVGPSRYFYEDTEFISNQSPGPGFHNPHDEVPHLRMNKTTHKSWLQKHKKEGEYYLKKNRSIVGPPSYNPCSLQYRSFDRTALSEKKTQKKQSKNGFGTDTKFVYDRPNKKKIIETRPASCTYNMRIEWKGKDMDAKKNNWIRTRSTGFSERIYN